MTATRFCALAVSSALTLQLSSVSSIATTAFSLDCPGAALAAGLRTVDHFTPQGPLVEGMIDGARVIDKMSEAASALDDYSLVFEAITFKKSKDTIYEKGKLYFKKPHLMRLEEIGDFQKGSMVVIGKDGKAHARGGGLARFITLTLDPRDKQLDAANGDKMVDSDFISLANTLKSRLKQGQKSRASSGTVTAPGVNKPCVLLELYKPDNAALVLKRIYLDPESHLPMRWDDYDYAMPCSSTWSEIKTNPGLSDDLFKL